MRAGGRYGGGAVGSLARSASIAGFVAALFTALPPYRLTAQTSPAIRAALQLAAEGRSDSAQRLVNAELSRGRPGEAAWVEACRELDAASVVPWVVLSGGVDDATFERQVAVACRAGASGVLVGRSVWAPAATMAPADRDAWLASAGRERLLALARFVDELGTPWHARPNPLASATAPGEGWYREY